MRYILFPGRHHTITRFQIEHLQRLIAEHPGSEVVWAITSADHGGTQRNPIPGHRRLGMIEAVTAAHDLPSLTYLIANRLPKHDFSHYVIEEIRTQTGGQVSLTPDNTIVACSTPAVIDGYVSLGFPIDHMELGAATSSDNIHDAPRPWDVMEHVISAGLHTPTVTALMDPVAARYFQRYRLDEAVQQVYNDPLIDSDDGDITITRDYATYRAAFEDNAWRKVADFAHVVRPGRIVDIGCATGQTIKLLSERPHLFESDFYGVEVARPLYEICQQRKSNGEFARANVYFHQRNIMQSELFEPDSIDTVITMALTHEIESYLGRDALKEFCRRVFTMLRPGGVWINYDVVGPQGRTEPVLAQFNRTDGAADGTVAELSSHARFLRFAQDFRRAEGDGITFNRLHHNGEEFIEITRGDLYEYLAKKDYIESWDSEAHEKFCFFTPQEWDDTLTRAGFTMNSQTRAITNPWLIENRFSPAARVFTLDADGSLTPDDWSWTNVMLVAEKPIT